MITWKELKESIEQQGVIDSTEITWIDIDGYLAFGEIKVEKSDDQSVIVKIK